MGLFDTIEENVSAVKNLFGGGTSSHLPGPDPGLAPKPDGAGAAPSVHPAAKPDKDTDAKVVDPKMVAGAADTLARAMKGWGTDEAAIHNALRGKSASEIEAIKQAYAKNNPGSTLDADLKSELSGNDLNEAQAYLSADPVKSATAALKNASAGLGTDESKIMTTLKAMTPEQQAEVRAQFKKETGQSVDKMLEDELSDKELKGAKAELAGKFSVGLGKDIDDLTKKSPTLQSKLSALQDDDWKITYGTAGKGTFADRGKKTIVVDPDNKGATLDVVQSLAHESGHAAYTMDPYSAPKGKTKDGYVQANVMRNLKDEGEATITNLEVRRELLAAKAGDIGVAGAKGEEYKKLYEKYPDAKDRDKLRAEIGKVYAKGEVPSVKKPDGTPYANYEEYYARPWNDYWDKNVTPGKDGRAPQPKSPPTGPDEDHDHSDHGH